MENVEYRPRVYTAPLVVLHVDLELYLDME